MSRKGGYKIIDLKGTALTSGTAATIAGIYEAIESTNKRIVLSGLVIGTTEYDDMEVDFTVSSSNFVGIKYFGTGTYITFSVDDDDKITATLTAPSETKKSK